MHKGVGLGEHHKLLQKPRASSSRVSPSLGQKYV